MKLRKDLPNKMKHIKLFEDFDLDNFLENPEEEVHGDLDMVDVGSYVNTYRGPGQIIDSVGNFWVIEPIAASSGKNFKVPKDGVDKMVLDDVKKMKSSASSSVNTKRELESLNSDIENFMEGSISDEDGEWKYRGNVETAIEFIEEIIVDLHSLNKRDRDMKFTDSFSKVVSNLAILFDNLLEASEDKVGMEERIKSLIGEIQSF